MVTQELLDKCHPLGMFDSISTLAVASNMRELYRLVLVDTPLAPYFAESLTSGLVMPAPWHVNSPVPTGPHVAQSPVWLPQLAAIKHRA